LDPIRSRDGLVRNEPEVVDEGNSKQIPDFLVQAFAVRAEVIFKNI